MQIYTKSGTYTKTFIKYMRIENRKCLCSTTKDIYDAYKKPSIAKVKAYKHHLAKADSYIRILAHNNHHFTVAYYSWENDVFVFTVATGYNTYKIPYRYL